MTFSRTSHFRVLPSHPYHKKPTNNPQKPTRTHNTANMVTRYTTKGDGAAVQDLGRANSERVIEKANGKKWMDGIVADSNADVDAIMKKLK